MTLDQLKVGATGTIKTVGGEGALRCRFLDMGLIPRTAVTLQKVAPMVPGPVGKMPVTLTPGATRSGAICSIRVGPQEELIYRLFLVLS